MRTTFISTRSIGEATRLSLIKAQARLSEVQEEVATGRLADVGRGLGFRTGQTVSLRQDHALLQTIRDTNSVAVTRLEATQAVLGGLAADAESFIGALVAARGGENGPRVALAEARTRLGALLDGLNTAIDGAHIFAGTNAGQRPLEAYFGEPPPVSRQAVAAGFLGAFGLSQADPAVAGIPAADMQQFLDGAFAALTDQPAWSTTWSTAADENIRSRISLSELVETSAGANASAVRKLVSAYVMVADLGVENLNQGAFQAVIDTAVRTAAGALQDLTVLRTTLGTAEERIASASAKMAIQADILTRRIDRLEAVDPYEASTRLTSLLTQIETTYALTARLQKLSLLDHL